MDIDASKEIRQDTKEENVRSEDTVVKKQEHVSNPTKHCDVELVGSEHKSEEIDLPPKVVSPIKRSGMVLSSTADSQISSHSNSEDADRKESKEHADVNNSKVKSKDDVKEESIEPDLKSSQNKEDRKQTSDAHSTNKTVMSYPKKIESMTEKPKIADAQLTQKNESKSSKDDVKVIPNVSSKTAVKSA